MKIQNGKLYENKTWQFLFPCFKAYGEETIKRLNSFYKLAVGIGDLNHHTSKHCIYILIDTNIALTDKGLIEYKKKLSVFLSWLKSQSFYVTDYMFDNSETEGKHMVVLKVPEKYDKAYSHFISGEYSKMYTKEEIEELFKVIDTPKGAVQHAQNEKVKKSRKVLLREETAVKTFLVEVNEKFKSTVDYADFKGAEACFPIKIEEEVFNYDKKLTL